MEFQGNQGSLKEVGRPEHFSNNSIAKSVSIKNRRATDNWKQLVRAIELQKNETSTALEHDRHKLLEKRDEIQTKTMSLKSLSSEQAKPGLLEVYDRLMASMGKKRRARSGMGTSQSITRDTESFERKRVIRKNVSLSLSELKKREQRHSLKSTEMAAGKVDRRTSSGDDGKIQQTRPPSAFEYTEEEKNINPKLYSSPTALPSIYLQKTRRPRFRSFDKDDDDACRNSESPWKDIQQCRHLRIQTRAHTMSAINTNRA